MQAHAKIQSGPQNKIRAQNITRRYTRAARTTTAYATELNDDCHTQKG